MKLGITAPAYVSTPELARQLIAMTKSIKTQYPFEFVIVENYIHPAAGYELVFDQQPESVHKLQPTEPQGVAKGWNLGINKCIELGCDLILVANIDIEFRFDCIDELVKYGQERPDVLLWSGHDIVKMPTNNQYVPQNIENDRPSYSCYMIRNDFMEKTKGFDENYAAYGYDDCDMQARIQLSGALSRRTWKATFFTGGSQTVKQDKHFADVIMPQQFIRNRDYFTKKWGRGETHDVSMYFQHPFNNPEHDVHFWQLGVDK